MSFDVLAKETQICGNCLLEASAGTGKTFSIQHIALRLLLEEKLPLNEILLVTFTKASTRELHARVRKNIEEVLRAYRQGKSLFPYMEKYCAKEAILLLENALRCFDEASIYTIHGFCHQLLQEQAFFLGLPLELPLVDEKLRQEKRRRFVREYLYSLDTCVIHPQELVWLFQKKKTFEKIYSSLEQYLHGSNRQSFRKKEHLYEQLQSHRKQLEEKKFSIGNFEQEIITAYPSYKKQNREESELLDELPYLEKFFQGLLTLEDWILWAKTPLALFSHFTFDTRKKYGKYFSSTLEDFAAFASEYLLPYFTAVYDEKRILSYIAQQMRSCFFSFLEQEQDLSFDELLKQTKSLLQNDLFVQEARKMYQAVIIDEAQDTDPVQWHIFSTLFYGFTKAFYLVGDPKQSIYGFRNADIYTYLQASEKMERKFFLNTNYRSDPHVQNYLNRFFSYRKNWLYLPKLEKALSYQKVRCSKEEEDPQASMLFWVAFGSAKKEKWPTKELEEELFFPEIAKTLMDFQKQSPKDSTAILVKDRFQGQRICTFLENRRIACSMKVSVSLVDCFMYQAFYDFLAAIVFPYEQDYVKKALITPFWGKSFAQLSLIEDSLVEKAQKECLFLQQELQRLGFARFWSFFFDYTLDEMVVQKRLFEKKVFLQARDVLEHLLETCQKIPFSIEAFSLFWQEASLLDEKAKVADQEAVQIMSIHASKGLEFDLVIPIGLVHRSPAPQTNHKEIDAEKFRQLYVGLTRAKKQMYVPVLCDLSLKPVTFATASSMELFFSHLLGKKDLYEGLQILGKKEVLALFSSLDLPYKILESTIFSAKKSVCLPSISFIEKPYFVDSTKKILSFSSLRAIKEQEDKTPYLLDNSSLPLGSYTGTLLHTILEKALRQRVVEEKTLLEKIPASYRPFEEEISRLIFSALDTPFFPGGPSAKSLALHQKQVEVEFVFRQKENLYKGFIDLLFFYEKKWYIVDWKSNYLPSCAKETIISYAQEQGYLLQAQIYQNALAKHLQMHGISGGIGGIFFVFLRLGPTILSYDNKKNCFF